jgi:O-antigen/teichoic acid export membrane protein
MLTSVAVARGLGLVRGLVLAGLLSPTEYGVATLVAVVVAYASFADLGLSTAACREISIGVGRRESLASIIAARHLTALRLGAGLVAGVLAYAASGFFSDAASRVGLRWALPVVLASCFLSSALLRWQAEGQAARVARGTLALALLDTLLAISFTRLFGLRGLLFALLAAPTVLALWLSAQRAFVTPALPARGVLRSYLGVGLPWVALGLAEHNLVYLNHVLVLAFLGAHALGIFNVGLVVADVLRMVALAAGLVLGPRLIQRFGAHGGAIEAVRELTLTPVLALASALPFLAVALYFVAKGGILRYYPLYGEVLPVLGVLLLAGQLLAINNGASSFLLAIGKQGRGAAIATGALMVHVLLVALLVPRGGNVATVAWATAGTYLLFSGANLGYIHSHFRASLAERLLFWIRAVLPALYSCVVVLAVEGRLPYVEWPLDTFIAIAASWLLLAPLAWEAVRLLKLVDAGEREVAVANTGIHVHHVERIHTR